MKGTNKTFNLVLISIFLKTNNIKNQLDYLCFHKGTVHSDCN
jgi:hypothetical protein